MKSDFEQELRTISLRPVPTEWRTRIIARATAHPRPSGWFAFLWPHPAFWTCIAAAWMVVAILSCTGPRGKALYTFGPEGAERKRISPEAYAAYMSRCAEFDLEPGAQIVPLRQSDL